jgi:DNA-3-methyladenine glycosylase I
VKPNEKRCAWADSDPLLAKYHDQEWGIAEHDDDKLFELLNLEGAQAGLSWLTVLKKRAGYRKAFEGFDAKRLARWPASKRAAQMKNEGIIRNRQKIMQAAGIVDDHAPGCFRGTRARR